MKLWILTAALAVVLMGGAVDAVARATALLQSTRSTIDADTAHKRVEHLLVDRSSGVPVFAGVITRVFANATLNEPVDDFKRRLSQHSGKTYAYGKRTNTTPFAVRLALAPHLYPLLC